MMDREEADLVANAHGLLVHLRLGAREGIAGQISPTECRLDRGNGSRSCLGRGCHEIRRSASVCVGWLVSSARLQCAEEFSHHIRDLTLAEDPQISHLLVAAGIRIVITESRYSDRPIPAV